MYVSTWDEQMTEESTLSLLKDLSLAHALEGGKFGKEIASLIQENDFAALVAYELPMTRVDWDVSQLIHSGKPWLFTRSLVSWVIPLLKDKGLFAVLSHPKLLVRKQIGSFS